jgi:hypothetical protein
MTIAKRQMLLVMVIVLVVIQSACGNGGSGSTSSGSTSSGDWVKLSGNIWTGVKVYYGEARAYGFEVLGGGEGCKAVPSGRGIKVKYPDGTVEWKDRSALIKSGLYFIQVNDPALKQEKWEVFDNC